ncbi:MAG: hypothetical protein KDA73_03200 [Rhodobacteraceae bacterium]|nr:hypothetical protein [Paracoccaceae bacterium]
MIARFIAAALVLSLLAACGLEGPPIRPKPNQPADTQTDTGGRVTVEGGGYIGGAITEED